MESVPPNINENIADKFMRMAAMYSAENKVFKANAYRRAANSILLHPTPLTSGKEAMELRGVGKSLGAHIDEIIDTGRFSKLEDRRNVPQSVTIGELCRISGIGPVTARKLVEQHGVTSIEDLRNKVQRAEVHLNKQQSLGLRLLVELETRIPRSEMDAFQRLIQQVVRDELHWTDDRIHFDICGSYRRGKAESGDIDILVTQTEPKRMSNGRALSELVNAMKRRHIVTDVIGLGDSKFAGIAKLPDTETEVPKPHFHRRIDIRIVDMDEYYPALLYYTGSGVFNAEMRRVAISKGFKLNEYGLFRLNRQRVQTNSERDLFDALDLPYVEPHERETMLESTASRSPSQSMSEDEQDEESVA